ncbi:MAG: GGDEF domain-containing protein [Trueperaceae bacterium]|nr:GGDEF domain-containing protein [Trueperaceae bacterium]
MGKTGLRDHAREMLLEIAEDLDSHQSETEQDAKSKGHAPDDEEDSAAEVHGSDRLASGFNIMETTSEFRALRASVVSHWTKAHPTVTDRQLADLTRFHEAIDQAVAESVRQYSTEKEIETRLFGAVLLASPDPVFVLDLEGRFVYANKATSDLFALEREAIIGKSLFELEFPFASELQHNLETVIADQSTYRGKFVHTFASGRGERFDYLLAPVLDEDQRTETTVCIFRDITEQALAEEKIQHAAHHDLLTGLPNRRLFLDRLEQEIKHAERSDLPLSVLFVDLDGFKDVNDSFGHEVGDALLSEVAQRFSECVREEDTVARHGGDEFTVIITGAQHRDDVELVAQKIRDALEVPFQIAERPFHISASIGISSYPHDATSPAALLDAADRAMYEAKRAGADD